MSGGGLEVGVTAGDPVDVSLDAIISSYAFARHSWV